MREFVKDRADLEREYARKLELLVKRHALKKDVIMEKKSNEIIRFWTCFNLVRRKLGKKSLKIQLSKLKYIPILLTHFLYQSRIR